MALTGEYFTCDGSNRIFTPSTDIISQNHVRVDYYLTDPEVTYNVDLEAWYLVNNSIIFKEAPPATWTLVITISNIGIDLGTPASEVSVVSHNMDKLRAIHKDLPILEDVSKTRPIYQEEVPSITDLNNGALWFQPSTKKEYILSEGEWIELSAGKAGQYQGHAGPKGYGIAWLDKKGVDNDTITIPENCAGYSVDEFVLGNGSEIVLSDSATYKVL